VKQLLPAAFMAIVIHGLLFILEVPRVNRVPVKPVGLKTISVVLAREYPEEQPVPATVPPVAKPSVPFEPERMVMPSPKLPEKPVRKITEEKRKVTVKKEIPALPPPPVEEMQPKLPDTGAIEMFSTVPDTAPVREDKTGALRSSIEMPPASNEGGQAASFAIADPNSGGSVSAATTDGALSEAKPFYKKNPRPHYPDIARKRNVQGTVVVLALVNEKGGVEETRVETSSGHALLDNAAIAAVKSWEFEPGRRGDKPVKSYVKLPITFQLK
jgi:protein TonB